MNTRFELILPEAQRVRLDALAIAVGSTKSELTRLGIAWVLEHEEFLRRGRPPEQREGEAA